jgi:hypothetical protein
LVPQYVFGVSKELVSAIKLLSPNKYQNQTAEDSFGDKRVIESQSLLRDLNSILENTTKSNT